MPVLCFVLDTSASMNRRTAQGQRVIDLAKTAIDNFLKKVESLSKIPISRILRPRSLIFIQE
jgi:nitric oxide reductase activation protein